MMKTAPQMDGPRRVLVAFSPYPARPTSSRPLDATLLDTWEATISRELELGA